MAHVFQVATELEGRSVTVRPPAGALGGWETLDDFTVDMFYRVEQGAPLFTRRGLPEGSDPSVQCSDPSSGLVLPWNQVRHAIHTAMGEARQQGRVNDGAFLRYRFSSILRDFTGVDADFVAGSGSRRQATFRATSVPVSGNSARQLQFVPQDRRSGARSGNLSFRADFGQLAEVRTLIRTQPQPLLQVLERHPELCFSFGIPNRKQTMDAVQTLGLLASLSCVLLGLWLRFARNALSDAILVAIRQPVRVEGGVGAWTTHPIARSGNRLLWNMAQCVAQQRGLDPLVYWTRHLGEALREVDIFAIALAMKIDIIVLQTGIINWFADLIGKGEVLSGIVTRDKLAGFSESVRDVRGFILFRGCADSAHAKKYDNRKGNTCVMRCSFLADTDAHVDFVFDPFVEATVVGKRYNRFRYDVVYQLADNPRASEGYFDRVRSEVVADSLQPVRVPSRIEPQTVAGFVSATSRRVVFVDTWDQYVGFRAGIVDAARAVFVHADGRRPSSRPVVVPIQEAREMYPGVLPELFDVDVVIDVDTIEQFAVNNLGMTEVGIPGLVYVFADLYKALVAAGLGEKFAYTNFAAALGLTRAREMFNQVISKVPLRADGRPDPITRFDDVNMFAIQAVSPVFISLGGESDRCVVANTLCFVRLYSARLIKIGYALLEAPWVQQAIVAAAKDKMGDAYDESKTYFNRDRAAIALSHGSLFLAMANNRPRLLNVVNRRFATYLPVDQEMVYVYDPQVDEPVVPHASLARSAERTSGFWELDINMCYTQMLMGTFDHMLRKDFYGYPWIKEVPRRPVFAEIDFTAGDFLQSYQACLGFVFVKDIDFSYLEGKLPEHFTRVNSWYRFAKTNKESVQRFVPNASVIHLTSYVSGLFGVLGIGPEDETARWVHIQRDVLRIRGAYFHHSPETRSGIIAAMKHCSRRVDDQLRGIWFSHGGESDWQSPCDASDGLDRFRDDLDALYVDEVRLLRSVGMSDREAYKAVKVDLNRAIGTLKSGKYLGGISVKPARDIMHLKRDDGTFFYEHKGTKTPYSSLLQIHARELPGTDEVLVETTRVRPVALQGHPRGLRIDVLERARHVVDILAISCKAFQVRTDAVFFEHSELGAVTEMLANEHGMKHYDPDDLQQAAGDCRENGCEWNKFCHVHSPMAEDVAADDDPERPCSLRALLPFKLIPRHGMEAPEDYDLVNAMLVGLESAALAQPNEHASLQKVSEQGMIYMAKGISAVIKSVDVHISSYVAGVVSCLAKSHPDHGFRTPSEPTDLSNTLLLHCNIVNGSFPFVYMGTDPCVLHSVDPIEYRAKICSILHELMTNMLSTGDGLLLEGPPGTGKSHTVREYIRSVIPLDTSLVFVATATHLTLRPYLELEALGDRVSVSTIHSFLGVFDEMPEVSFDPHEWLFGEKSHVPSRFRKTLQQHRGTYDRIYIFIDEFEMLPVECEEILFYVSRLHDVKLVLLGDRKQTAAYGRGVRCDGDIVKRVTCGQTIHFDLQFRNADYDFVRAQHLASTGKPTMYLKAPLSNYTLLPTLESKPSGENAATDCSMAKLFGDAMGSWLAAQADRVLYTDPVVSCQNYKAFVVVTLGILSCKEDWCTQRPGDWLPFVGSDAKGVSKRAMGGDAVAAHLGTVDQETDEVVETTHQRNIGALRYAERADHILGDPSSRDFLIGTKMIFRPWFSYRTVKAFIPKIRLKSGDGEFERQAAVRMGTVLMMRTEFKEFNDVVADPSGRRRKITYTAAVFEDDGGKCFFLRQEEAQSYMYYPFCLYTEGVVGHTFDRYYMVQFMDPNAKGNDYMSIKAGLEDAESKLGKYAWMSPRVKTLNVATSRVTIGNRVNVIEIASGGKYFWRPYVYNSRWHACHDARRVAPGRETDPSYVSLLKEWRGVVVASTRRIESAMTYQNLICL